MMIRTPKAVPSRHPIGFIEKYFYTAQCLFYQHEYPACRWIESVVARGVRRRRYTSVLRCSGCAPVVETLLDQVDLGQRQFQITRPILCTFKVLGNLDTGRDKPYESNASEYQAGGFGHAACRTRCRRVAGLKFREESVLNSLKKQQKSVIWFHEQKTRTLRLCRCIKHWP